MPKKAALIFTAILFSVVIIYFAAIERVEEKEIATPKQTAFAVLSEITDLDTDGDGLYDWEEELWKSDPNNKDTDGDGTNDNDEVKEGRNPTVAGPDDLLNEGMFFFDNTESIHTENTEIDILAQDLFTDYLELKKADNLNLSNEQELVERLINENTESFNFERYTIGDLNIGNDGNEAVLQYRTSISLIFQEFAKVEESELVVLTRALQKNNEAEFEKLDSSIQIYNLVIRDLSELVVPNKARFIHVDLLNGLNYFVEVIEGMSSAKDDPVKAIASINAYATAESYLEEVFTELNAYFEDQI